MRVRLVRLGVRPPILRFDPREQESQAKNRKIGGLTPILVYQHANVSQSIAGAISSAVARPQAWFIFPTCTWGSRPRLYADTRFAGWFQRREAPAFNSPDRQVGVTVTKKKEARGGRHAHVGPPDLVIISNCLPRPYGRGYFITALRACDSQSPTSR
jgi:hypothetical protein